MLKDRFISGKEVKPNNQHLFSASENTQADHILTVLDISRRWQASKVLAVTPGDSSAAVDGDLKQKHFRL